VAGDMKKTITLTQTDRFQAVMLSEGLLTESEAKHLALAKNNRIMGA